MELLPQIGLIALLLTGHVEHSVTVENEHQRRWTGDGRVGIRVNYGTGRINHVYKGSPAEGVGIRPEDVVLEVDGAKKACRRIHGTPGTTVHLKLRRGEQEFEVDVTRADRSTLPF